MAFCNDCWHANLFLNVPASSDPCKDSENSLNTICRVQAVTRQPQFYMPPESCRPESEPLCASDGHTYPSECAMKATGLQKSISLRKIHSGACGKLGKRTAWESQIHQFINWACISSTYLAHFFFLNLCGGAWITSWWTNVYYAIVVGWENYFQLWQVQCFTKAVSSPLNFYTFLKIQAFMPFH